MLSFGIKIEATKDQRKDSTDRMHAEKYQIEEVKGRVGKLGMQIQSDVLDYFCL